MNGRELFSVYKDGAKREGKGYMDRAKARISRVRQKEGVHGFVKRDNVRGKGVHGQDERQGFTADKNKNKRYQDEDGVTRMGQRQGLTWRIRIKGTRMRMGSPGRGKPRPYIYSLTRFHK